MANSFHGEATATVGGDRYTLRLDFNAMCDFEEATGANAMDVLAAFEKGKASTVHLRALVWAMMQAHHPGLPIRVAGDILSHDLEAMQRVLQAAMPAAPEGAAGNGYRRTKRPA